MARKTRIAGPTTLPIYPKLQRFTVKYYTTRNDGRVEADHIRAFSAEDAAAHARRSIINLDRVISVHDGYL